MYVFFIFVQFRFSFNVSIRLHTEINALKWGYLPLLLCMRITRIGAPKGGARSQPPPEAPSTEDSSIRLKINVAI